eukprot:Blabericola_migrator_1__4921@NODE_2569_length_2595_cov_63_464399_g1607_i0_p1_GENE_NODE_2569_length_2595_cov_63_464399_g1607_i0NODE_2569_length_2595_cov_63_464399_g1607_i0_p1_ORF_typecomplete_len627_score110_74_NODE_2569_length_2595_cov_63_464399_g1607_i06952575
MSIYSPPQVRWSEEDLEEVDAPGVTPRPIDKSLKDLSLDDTEKKELFDFVKAFANRVATTGIGLTYLHKERKVREHHHVRWEHIPAILIMDDFLTQISIKTGRSVPVSSAGVYFIAQIVVGQAVREEVAGISRYPDAMVERMILIRFKKQPVREVLLLCDSVEDLQQIAAALSLFRLVPRYDAAKRLQANIRRALMGLQTKSTLDSDRKRTDEVSTAQSVGSASDSSATPRQRTPSETPRRHAKSQLSTIVLPQPSPKALLRPPEKDTPSTHSPSSEKLLDPTPTRFIGAVSPRGNRYVPGFLPDIVLPINGYVVVAKNVKRIRDAHRQPVSREEPSPPVSTSSTLSSSSSSSSTSSSQIAASGYPKPPPEPQQPTLSSDSNVSSVPSGSEPATATVVLPAAAPIVMPLNITLKSHYEEQELLLDPVEAMISPVVVERSRAEPSIALPDVSDVGPVLALPPVMRQHERRISARSAKASRVTFNRADAPSAGGFTTLFNKTDFTESSWAPEVTDGEGTMTLLMADRLDELPSPNRLPDTIFEDEDHLSISASQVQPNAATSDPSSRLLSSLREDSGWQHQVRGQLSPLEKLKKAGNATLTPFAQAAELRRSAEAPATVSAQFARTDI